MKTVETYVPKVVVEEKIVEVPKFVPEYVEKVSNNGIEHTPSRQHISA